MSVESTVMLFIGRKQTW